MKQENTIGWLSAASFGMAGTINFFNLGPVLQVVGNVGILLFIIGMLIALISGFGWIQLALQHPSNVGGATVNCYPYFKSRSPFLLTILCFGNWTSWVAQAALSATFCASAIVQWFSLSYFSSIFLSSIFLFICILIALLRLTIAARIIVPLAILATTLLIFSAILPLIFNKVNLHYQDVLMVKLPFSGWFGYLTAIMSGFYLVGWIVPAYEVTTWLTGEMKHPQKNLPIAFILTGLISCLTFIILPIIWLSCLGYQAISADYTAKTNWVIFSGLFPGLGTTFASLCAFLLIVSYLCCSGIGSIVGPSRMLVQLAEYGLLPSSYKKRLKNGAPWVAVCTAGLISMLMILFGTPIWLIAATNFGYLASMILASLGAWLMANAHANIKSLSKKMITLGLTGTLVWVFSLLFGYQQYGMIPMLGGVLFVLLGVLPYLWRKMIDIHERNEQINLFSIHITLPLLFFIIVGLNSTGYLLLLLKFPQTTGETIVILQDIFITVILLTLTLGLWITDSVAHVAVEISKASNHLAKVTMPELVIGMKALGSGILDKINFNPPKKIIVETHRKDELGIMIRNFSALEEQIGNIFINMENTREQLIISKEKMLETQQQLYINAHEAGMAQVATNVLHNVGNILNSANISAALVKETIQHLEVSNLISVAKMMDDHKANLANFLTEDDKGMLLSRYLKNISHYWQEEQQKMIDEVNNLIKHIDHIKDIVSAQQSLSGLGGVEQEVNVAKVLNDAIKISAADFDQHGIKVEIVNHLVKPVMIDKIKLMQILINLIRNAKEALINSKNEKILKVNIYNKTPERFTIEIIDTGEGIRKEDLVHIFTHGYTTKKKGHGFGLHSCALAAQEMQGNLSAYSQGPGTGATFILDLPCKNHVLENQTLY